MKDHVSYPCGEREREREREREGAVGCESEEVPNDYILITNLMH